MVIAIDPGYTTGVSVATNINWQTGDYTTLAVVAVEWPDRLQYFLGLFATYKDKIDAIVIEDFILTQDPKTIRSILASWRSRIMPSARIIGIIECAATVYGLQAKLVYQQPADRKNVRIPDHDREIVGLLSHRQDAYRHMRYYIEVEKGKRNATRR